ncbi:MAG: DUF362 domain-containing protein [Candidatus Omnitrophica bacterium]|jgi:uncharacterized protein (DUF362 family)/NAD-dependent dihydropyrimidine dehydrogenase PreA subunit|nr:DUF362 domain-containing protein [Candidatus Omnitrophota bacterium]
MSKVLILDTDYNRIKHDIEKVFQEFKYDFKGKKVFVKPNLLGSFAPDKGVTTHPAVVSSVVDYLISHGASVVVGDNCGMPRAYGDNESVAKVTGIYEASKGHYINIGKSAAQVKTGIPGYPEAAVARAVLECDYFISLPKFKTHLNTIITAGIKNSYGLLVGSEKTKLHSMFPEYKKFAKAVVEVFKIRPPDLVIMDAIVGMQGDGPNSSDLRNINKVIASNDTVAVDAIICYMMGADPAKVDTMRLAREENLGQADIKKMQIIGNLERLSNFKLPSTYNKEAQGESLPAKLILNMVRKVKLKVSSKKCISCKQCYEICPVKAIDFDKYPRINARKCIACFCCKEVCPVQAISIGGILGLLQKIIR